MKQKQFYLILCVSLFLGSGAFAENIKRLALLVGVNDGGKERTVLRYAGHDVQAVSRVFKELGGMEPEDMLILKDSDSASVVSTLQQFAKKAEKAKESFSRVEVFFYYSGHSDEKGLLLKGKHFEYPHLRAMIEQINADVKISVLDSCSSGAITRKKGGQKISPFLMDSSMKMKGHAFITSSSYDEASQESDRIQGSFFTHYFITGLRGAADMNKDGRVTLNEIYQFAFYETLSRTEKTLSGPQHPGYEIEMAGSGDVVVTDLRQSSSLMVFEESIEGRVSVRDSRGIFVAELQKLAGKPVQLGLEPGKYHVLLSQTGKVLESDVELKGFSTLVSLQNMKPVFISDRVVKKGDDEIQVIPFSLSLFPPISTGNPDEGKKSRHYMAFNLLAGESDELFGLGFGGVNLVHQGGGGGLVSWWANWVTGDFGGVQASAILNYNAGVFSGVQASAVGNINLKDFSGAQFSAVFNVSGGNFFGLQSSAVLNFNAGDLKGLQLSIVNISKSASSQVGILNIALHEVRGLQLGIINIGGESAVPIGLFNFVKNGDYRFSFWADNLGFAHGGFRTGGKYAYSMFSAGIHDFKTRTVTYAWALGAHIPVGAGFFIEAEIFSQFFKNLEDQLKDLGVERGSYTGLQSFRLMAGYEFFNTLSVFAGVSLPVYYLNEANDSVGSGFVKPLQGESFKMSEWVTLMAGVHLRLF